MLRKSSYVIVTVLLCFIGCGSEELIQNPMVDRWCGERPCAWDVSGRVERIGTWHSDDYAVALLGSDTTLSQANAVLDDDETTCLGFSMIADISARARVFVELDFLDDGVIDFSQRIPESHWTRRTFLIRTPSWYEGVRFIVRKEGAGRAALAELRAHKATDCTAPAVELLNRPAGARCQRDEQCKGERCSRGACAFCRGDEDCGEGEVCGIASDGRSFAERCVRTGSAGFAEQCTSSSQCVTGTVCCEGVCSQCCPGSVACSDGAICKASSGPANATPFPHQCAAGERKTPSRGPCLLPQDCQSGVCRGAMLECAICAEDADEGDSGAPASICLRCTSFRRHGGTCD
jgi:hypothetical protein